MQNNSLLAAYKPNLQTVMKNWALCRMAGAGNLTSVLEKTGKKEI
jgi:hypothetical protein